MGNESFVHLDFSEHNDWDKALVWFYWDQITEFLRSKHEKVIAEVSNI